jgi:hypothetical protein
MSRIEWLLSSTVLGIVALLLLSAAKRDGLVTDELDYIPAGYRHLFFRDYRLNPETPPVAKVVVALGLIGADVIAPDEPPAHDTMLIWSWRFLHVLNAGRSLVLRARIPVVVIALLLIVALCAWARATYGPAAGWAALLLAGFHPSLLAHGHLATTDLPAAAVALGIGFAFWRWSLAPGPLKALVVGAAFGFGLCTRLTCVVTLAALLPFALMSARQAAGRRASVLRLAELVLLGGSAAILLLWLCYGFRYEPWPGASVAVAPGPELGVPGAALAVLERLRLLPEAWLESVRWQLEHNYWGHPGFLLGHLSRVGWRHYFVVAFLVKNTPGFLLASAVAAALLWHSRARVQNPALLLQWLAPVGLLFVLISLGHVQIGERYLLAAYPGLILVIASQAPCLLARRRGMVLAAAILTLHALPALAAARDGYLTYFNFIAGGAQGGHRVLLDSNLDWGQDLPRLASWMRSNGVERVQLGYEGSDDPSRYGIRWKDLPGDRSYPGHQPGQLFAGVVAVSPNLLAGMPWVDRENPYAELAAFPPHERAGVFFIYRWDLFPPRPHPSPSPRGRGDY